MLSRFVRHDSLPALGLCLLLFWAPLPSAGVMPGAQLVFRLASFALLLLTVAVLPARWRWRRALPAAALAAIALFGLAQSLRWPAAVAGLVSEEHLLLYRDAHRLASPGDGSQPIYLSLAPSTSRSAAVSWLAAAALLTVAMIVGRKRRFRRWPLATLLLACLVQGGVGLVRLSAAADSGLAARLLRPEGRLYGSFANPNHVSLFLEIGLAVALAWVWWELRRQRRPARRLVRALAPLILWLVLFALVVLTGSRAGLVAAVVGAGAQIAVLMAVDRNLKVGAAVGLVLALGLGALAAFGSRIEIRRYVTVSLFEDNLRGRLDVLPRALELWRRFPLTGTGLGTFEDAFPLVAPPRPTRILWNHAHNDPLELLVTGGVVALGLGILAAGALLVRIGRVLRRGARTEDRAAALAAVGAFAAVGFHELLDFGLMLPANSAALLIVVGSAASAALRRRAAVTGEPRRA